MTTCRFGAGFADAAFRLFELEEPVLQELLKDDGRCVPILRRCVFLRPTLLQCVISDDFFPVCSATA